MPRDQKRIRLAAAIERISFAKHPWSLGGGGAVELKDLLELRSSGRLASVTDSIGFMCITKQDDVFSQPRGVFERARLSGDWIGEFVIGENVRDWSIAKDLNVFFPYEQDGSLRNLPPQDPAYRFLWPFRTALEARAVFGGATFRTAGKRWFEYGQIPKDRITGPAITFASIATHNHFVLDRGGKVFKQTAPIIKLATGSSEEDHLALLAYLNSSTACFWMKQVCFPKGGSGIGRGIQDEEWESRFEFDATKLASLPLPAPTPQHRELARALDQNAAARAALSPATRLANWLVDGDARDPALLQARAQRDALLAEAVALQERLDWQIYTDFGLLTKVEADELQRSKAFNSIEPGARAFESALIQSEPTTAWFTRNRYAIPQQPEPSPSVAAHTKALRQNKSLGLVERPEYKRRWGVPAHEAEERSAACALLADATEADFGANTVTPRHLDQRVRGRFRQKIDVLLELAQRPLSDVLSESAAPFLASLRFTELGLDRHAEWERTWDLQRREDAGETLDKIAVPPKYGQSDYRSTTSWQLRGPLDVPKERFISYPACESDQDSEPVYGWGGWDHEQRARALATLYVNRRDEESWPKERLTPMLAGLLELLPWVTQWHGTPSDDYAGVSPGAYYEGFLDDECRKYGLTRDDLRAWRPAERKRAAAKAANSATETGTWRLAETLALDDGAYYAVAAAVLLRAQLPWQASAAGAIALDGGSALRFIDAAATKVWKRNLGADAKKDVDAAVLFAAAHKAVDDLKRDGAIHEGVDGTLAATGKLTLSTVRPTALVERVRFVLEHVMPHVESETQVLSMPTAKPAKVKNAKRQAV